MSAETTRIYLDVCALQRPLDDLSQVRVRLEAEAVLAVLEWVGEGRLTLLRSAAHDIENRRNPYPDRQWHCARVLDLAKERVPFSEPLRARAATAVAAGIDGLDALHLAAAVEGASDFFCTVDDRLLRRAKRLNTKPTRIVSPLDLVMLLPNR